MANQLSKTGIQNSQTIQAWHVTQSIDALTAAEAYDITISGSLTLTGSVSSLNGFTGDLVGTASWASDAVSAVTASHAVTALSSSYALTALSASYALSSSYSVSASHAELADLATNATNATNAVYADNTIINIKNVSGGIIPKGTPCFVTGSGTSGNLAGVVPADAGDSTLMPAGIIAGEQLAIGAEGVGLVDGFINGVDTSGFSSGDEVFVAVGGGYINVAPTGSALIQKLGNVEKKASNGSGVINGPGAVRAVPNINPGYTWVGDSDWVATPTTTASFTGAGSYGASYPSGSAKVPTVPFKFLAGASQTDASGVTVVNVDELNGKTLGQTYFVTTGVDDADPTKTVSIGPATLAQSVQFTSSAANTKFHFQIMYI